MAEQDKLTETERPGERLYLRVPDSGRTWSVLYHNIKRIPADALQHGDVLIVRHATEPGVMLMQAIKDPKRKWRFADVGRPDAEA